VDELVVAIDTLMEHRLGDVARTTPAFASVLRAYRKAVLDGDTVTAQALISWLGGQPNVAASAERAAGVKEALDHCAHHWISLRLTAARVISKES
jgi:hypothetical protein